MFLQDVYERYGLLQLPRNWGFPIQITIRSVSHIRKLVEQYDGKYPVYISVNVHDDKYVLYSQTYCDFDGHGKHTMEEALKDTRKLGEYLESEKIDFLPDLTGRGFRILIKTEPVIRKIEDMDRAIKGYTKHLAESLGLKTMDLKVGESKRIMRPPLTRYIYYDHAKKENIITPRHVLPMTSDILFDASLEEMIYMSEHLDYHVQPVCPNRLPITVMDEYEISTVYFPSREVMSNDYINFMDFPSEYFKKEVYEMIRDYDDNGMDMGSDTQLVDKLYTSHPDHNTLFVACIKIKEGPYHLGLLSAISFFEKLSLDAKWKTRNLEIQKQQIKHIYANGYRMVRNR